VESGKDVAFLGHGEAGEKNALKQRESQSSFEGKARQAKQGWRCMKVFTGMKGIKGMLTIEPLFSRTTR
jgi:hypothetical protein